MIESLDQIMVGDYLIIVRGPLIRPKSGGFFMDTFPPPKPEIDRLFEGMIVKVIALSPPIMLLETYWMKNNGTINKTIQPMPFDYMGWAKAMPAYVEKFLNQKVEMRKPMTLMDDLSALFDATLAAVEQPDILPIVPDVNLKPRKYRRKKAKGKNEETKH